MKEFGCIRYFQYTGELSVDNPEITTMESMCFEGETFNLQKTW
jgi:hypothetical protein